VVLTLFIGSSFFLLKSENFEQPETNQVKKWRIFIALSLISPFLSVAIGQLLRGNFYPPNFDAPIRIALCATIFFAISRGWLSSKKSEPITFIWVKYIFPLTLIFTFFYKPSWSTKWAHTTNNLITTYFIDVLSFGSITLLFSLLIFAALSFYWGSFNLISRLFLFCCVMIGFYLSSKSGSRTGWLNLPIFLIIWLFNISLPLYGRIKSLLILIIIGIILAVFIYSQPIFFDKFTLAIFEVSNYNWNKVNNDGSTELRISFYRMAFFYFLQNPIKGWGDLGWMQIINSPEISQYTTEYARNFAQHGFHNEILTNAVRSGIWGLISSLSFFIIPLTWAIKCIKQKSTKNNFIFINYLIVFLMVHIFLSGVSTEITNLVFLASFWGLTISIFVGESFYYIQSKFN